jgi:CHAD domain-containing protein
LVTAKSFQDSFKSDLKSLDNALEAFLAHPATPTEETVHDLRTSIRKIRAAYAILPKSEKKRNKELGPFVRACVAAFDASSPIRDIDVVRPKLANAKENSESKKDSEIELERERANKLVPALKKVRALNSLQKPQLDFVISDKKLDKRFNRRVKQLKRKSRELIPEVLSDESKAEELHMLRKCYKKLRYSLELGSPSKEVKEVVKVLKERQAVLGAIHDSDITLSFLEKDPVVGLKNLTFIRSERNVRHSNYQAFIDFCASSDV